MHSAPAVSYPVGRSRFQGWLIGLTGLGGVLLVLLWTNVADTVGWRQWLLGITVLGSCYLAGAVWWHSSSGSLRWDGQAWSWQMANASTSGMLTVHLDLQFVLLLSLRPSPDTRIWLWPERRSQAVRWNALRQAVFSRAPQHASTVPAKDEWEQVK